MSFIPRKEHQDVNDPHRQLWWKPVGEDPHMHIHREQGPHTHSSWGSQGQNSPSWYPRGYLMQSRKGATPNFQKSHLRRAWSTSQNPFWNTHLWTHQHLTGPSTPGQLCAEHTRCHQAVQGQQGIQTLTAHPTHFRLAGAASPQLSNS